MAFANLFKTLSTAEDHAIPYQSPRPYKNGVQELCATRRPNLGGQQTGQKKEKTHQHFNPAMTAKTRVPPTFYDYDNPDGNPRVPANFNRRGRDHFNHSGAFLQRTMDKKVQHQKFQNRTTFKQEMQQQNMGQKKKKNNNNKKRQDYSQSNGDGFANRRQLHQADRREWFPSKGRGNTQIHENKQNPPAKRVRPMTQEFKDQNALEADGLLLCKHFLMGRCTKALQRDKDLSELAKKSQQESLAQPLNLEVTAEEDSSGPKPDILLYPIRPHFYNSSRPEEPHSDALPAMEELIGTEPAHGPTHIESTSLSCSPLSSDLGDFKAVSYSVEAVLGPMNSKPFPSLFGSSRDSASSSSPPCSSAGLSVMANQVEAPYSVEAVLRSVKTVGGSNLTCTRGPPLSANPPFTYYGSDHSKEFPKHSRDSGLFNGKDLCSKPDTVESKEAKARSNGSRVVASSNHDHKQANRRLPVNKIGPPYSQSSAEGSGVVSDSNSSTYIPVVPVPVVPVETRPAKDSQKAFHSLFACPLNQNVCNPLHLKPLPSAAPSKPQHSVLSPDTATASTNGKEKTASSDTNTGHNAHVLARSLTQKPAHRQRADFKVAKPGVLSGSKLLSTESPGQAKTACRLSKPTHCDQSVLGRSKPVKRPYHSSIASSVTDSDEDLPPLQIATDLIIASSDSPEQSEVEPGMATGGVLHSLFATPIHETTALLPSAQGKPGTFKPRPGEGSSGNHTQNSGATGSPTSRPDPKQPNRKERKSRPNDRRPPTDPVQNDSGLRRQRDSHMPEVSSDKAPSNAATNTSNSVLKTLFLSLRPYDQEEERIIHSKCVDKGEINRGSIAKEPQTTGEQQQEETKRKEMRNTEMLGGVEPAGCRVHPDHQLQGSCEPTSQPTAPAKHRPLVKNPHSHSSGPSGGHTSGRLDPVQLVSLGAQHPPFGSKGPMTRPHIRPAQSPVKQPLKSLFKTLDPTASPFGS
ncbi:unnamed protein product [Lota lota]